MTRFASPETYLHTPIEAFLPESPDWADYGTRLLQQQGMNEVNEAQAELIRKSGDFAATRIREGGASAADNIQDRASSGLWGSALNLGLSVAGAGAKAGWFGGNDGVGVHPTYDQATNDALEYDWGSDAGYGGSWYGNSTPSYGDYRR